MILKIKQQPCCSGAGCCDSPDPKTETQTKINEQAARKIQIDFLYLDLEVCTRCQGTDQVLDEAVADVQQILQAAGVSAEINKVNINAADLAIQYQFVSSPTIRINGRDIDVDVKESLCESCGDLCGDSVDCRVWTYQGIEHNQPPKAMIINALLQAVYGPPVEIPANDGVESYHLPENLKKFYEAMSKKEG